MKGGGGKQLLPLAAAAVVVVSGRRGLDLLYYLVSFPGAREGDGQRLIKRRSWMGWIFYNTTLHLPVASCLIWIFVDRYHELGIGKEAQISKECKRSQVLGAVSLKMIFDAFRVKAS